MALLPSYQDAISRPDWLELAAPYIHTKDFGNLCAVNGRFNGVFAQRLWSDPLRAVRRLGLDPSDDLRWFLYFIFVHVERVRASTLALVVTLDFRDFAKNTTYFPSDNDPRTIPESFRRIPNLFPGLRSILLDGHAEIHPSFLGATPPPEALTLGITTPHRRPLLLSISHCQSQLPTRFFSSDYVKRLVYLDVSGLPGSLQPLIAAASIPQNLPNLRILKVRKREMGDAFAAILFKAFKDRLWSLDLRENNLTDSIVDHLRNYCLGSFSLRSESRARTEGALISLNGLGNETYGPFKFIKESDWSGSFNHPERYFVDTPVYSTDGASRQEHETIRSDGRSPMRQDTVDYVNRIIAGGLDYVIPDGAELAHLDICSAPAGVTHLHLADNKITAPGIEKLVRISPGQLEYLDCGSPPFQPLGTLWPPCWPKGTRVYGVLGSAYAFRPVYSSNIRALRIHHSFITQIPTMEANGLSSMTRLWLAETLIRERSEMAFPQAFGPDMNPRLNSLTLTKIPRRAVGPLIKKLIHFLKLAATQERAIQDTTMSSSRRSPAMLRGLRYLRLELDADPTNDTAGLPGDNDLDAESLLTMKEGEGFSFFSDESATLRQSPTTKSKSQRGAGSLAITNASEAESGRLKHFPYSQATSEFLEYSGKWDSKPFTAQVWIGPGILGQHPAVNEYMILLRDSTLRSNVGAASPIHVKAGVPEGVLLYLAAWDAIIMPATLNYPTKRDLDGMVDVVDSLKKFRIETRMKYTRAQRTAVNGNVNVGEPHFFWTGKLEVVAQPKAVYHGSANYWR